MTTKNLKHGDELLRQIAEGVGELVASKTRMALACIKVTFVCGPEKYEFGLDSALDAIANDIYWDDRGNWADATKAIVETI